MGRGPGGLIYQVKGIMMRNRDGAGLTQDRRLEHLSEFVRTIYEKYKLDDIRQLRTKHVDYFASKLRERSIHPHSMRVRMAAVRWIAEKIGKPNIVARENAAYGFAEDVRELRKDQAWPDDKVREVLAKLGDARVALSVRGARHLGLRLEEASLVRPRDADLAAGILHLRRGTKGGRYRYVRLATPEARAWAQELARMCAADRCVIPESFRLDSWKSHVARELRKAGAGAKAGLRFHGLRHSFAQDVYRSVAKCEAPIKGGRPDPETHRRACKVVSKILGHNRWKIAEMYVGGLEAGEGE